MRYSAVAVLAVGLLLSNVNDVKGFVFGTSGGGRGSGSVIAAGLASPTGVVGIGWFNSNSRNAGRTAAKKAGIVPPLHASVSASASAPVTVTVASSSEEGVGQTWESIENQLNSMSMSDEGDDSSSPPSPVLTLYRDTNGWCPFCERVWVCIRAKNLPYQERLIALFDKPEWYKEMVPTTQVPAVLFHEWDSSASGTGTGTDGDNDSSSSNSRKLVWESIDIMQALDDAFPNTIQLVHDTPEYKAAKEQVEKLNKVGFEYIYATRNTGNDEDAPPLTEEEIDARREAFVAALDELNASLEKSCISDGDGDGDGSKPVFALGDQFSGIDAIMIPTLERWRYQLPLNSNIDSSAADILKNRPFLQKWFESMEGYKPFSDRVMGDEYSWIATNAMFAKYFGAGEETAKRSEDAASALVEGFCDDHESASTSADENGVFALEAARKIVSNREAIVKDCSNADPKSQASLARCKDADVADAVIRFVAEVLVKGTNESESAHTSAVENARSLPLSSALEEMGKDQRQDAALAAKTVASRLCAPRDMSAPAAKILRSVLMTVGNRLV